MKFTNFLFIVTLYFSTTLCFSQKLIKGIVVDSATLNNLSGVNVKVKHTNRGTSTNAEGIFTIVATEKDTLAFSFVGYSKVMQRVYLEDETMFVRLKEESLLLKEVIIKDIGFHLNQKYTKSPTLTSTKPLKAGSSGGIGVNFAYFSKLEKEKRKLVKVMADNEKVRIYLSIVNDPDVKSDIMERYTISEEKFYDLLSMYNEKNKQIMYSANSGLILNSLLSFFQNQTAKK
jgi:CarboxypepD_reg-like domain